MRSFTIRNSFVLLGSIISIVIVWEIVSIAINAPIIFPSPKITFLSLWRIIFDKLFLYTILGSISRWLISILVSFICAIIFGIFSGLNNLFNTMFKPYLHIIMATPVISIILVALIWFNDFMVPIFVSFLVCFPIICNNINYGIRNIDERIIQMANIYKVHRTQMFFDIYLPSLIPSIFSGLSTALALGWKVVIVTEVISQPNFSIGTMLYNANILLETENLFAWTIVVVLLSFIFDLFIKIAEKRIMRWKYI